MLLQLYICGLVLCLMSRQFYLALLQTCCYTALRACIVMCRNTTNYLSYLALLYKHAVVKLCGPVLLCEYYELSFLFSPATNVLLYSFAGLYYYVNTTNYLSFSPAPNVLL